MQGIDEANNDPWRISVPRWGGDGLLVADGAVKQGTPVLIVLKLQAGNNANSGKPAKADALYK